MKTGVILLLYLLFEKSFHMVKACDYALIKDASGLIKKVGTQLLELAGRVIEKIMQTVGRLTCGVLDGKEAGTPNSAGKPRPTEQDPNQTEQDQPPEKPDKNKPSAKRNSSESSLAPQQPAGSKSQAPPPSRVPKPPSSSPQSPAPTSPTSSLPPSSALIVEPKRLSRIPTGKIAIKRGEVPKAVSYKLSIFDFFQNREIFSEKFPNTDLERSKDVDVDGFYKITVSAFKADEMVKSNLVKTETVHVIMTDIEMATMKLTSPAVAVAGQQIETEKRKFLLEWEPVPDALKYSMLIVHAGNIVEQLKRDGSTKIWINAKGAGRHQVLLLAWGEASGIVTTYSVKAWGTFEIRVNKK